MKRRSTGLQTPDVSLTEESGCQVESGPESASSPVTSSKSSSPPSEKKSEKVQSTLRFTSPNSSSGLLASRSTTCSACGMTYYEYVPKDREIHKKYHDLHAQGIPWPESLSVKKVKDLTITINTSFKRATGLKRQKNTSTTTKVQIIAIDKSNKKQVQKTSQMLDMVNRELNAPTDSGEWMNPGIESSRAFVVVIENKAVGLCTTDTISDVQKQSRWMVHRTQSIVPKQVNKNSKIGISRIWVASSWRRYGLAEAMLQVVLTNSIYGVSLAKSQIAFSQPSHSGGLLAKKFNGVQHKSGEILLPVYLE
ncbi:ESCO1/2 acetyl-transferase-domain-containing protein [Scheffersomyces xylosifermentans]|uniref:ESCO1/2 acetyl-transferase-domain-containing protein n=1 Tax=Scheffersomyces xylosifermentans TaxID=1304137 RepID=UPI00315DB5B2